ncbi:tyrosine-protein phosphatase [Hamadaea tsunoensis]|uniref:tyrosine-protein phosphatase n=1 Tax=Hamadaea tsunoensis TaxID=53368 RepID=UPI0003F834D1|nr:tyrosine-protein phosphatase [Hamadaea tsunoensis]
MDRAFIDFERVFNFRDVGGLVTADGARVRTGLLYRSDNLGSLQEADATRYSGLGIKTVIDLRQPAEIVRQGGRAPAWACSAYHNVPLHNPAWREEDYSPAEGPVAYLVARYHEAVEGAAGPHLVTALRLLADAEAGPAVVHCLGGRDRTGMVVAFLLDLLGVSDEDIAADYHFTERATRRFMAWYREGHPETPDLVPYLDVTPAEVILTFLGQLRARHGSVTAYLMGNGLTEEDIAALRSIYLEEPAN